MSIIHHFAVVTNLQAAVYDAKRRKGQIYRAYIKSVTAASLFHLHKTPSLFCLSWLLRVKLTLRLAIKRPDRIFDMWTKLLG